VTLGFGFDPVAVVAAVALVDPEEEESSPVYSQQLRLGSIRMHLGAQLQRVDRGTDNLELFWAVGR
jgi:hypothetical protein